MKKLKALPKRVPKFKSYEEEAGFWDTHDTTSLMTKGRIVKVEFAKPIKHLISIRLDLGILKSLRVLAAKRKMPYQTLIQSLLAEKLEELRKKSA